MNAILGQISQAPHAVWYEGQLVVAETKSIKESDQNSNEKEKKLNAVLGQISQVPNPVWHRGQLVVIQIQPFKETDEK